MDESQKMRHVTVLIPTYNHGSILVYQIESLLKQTLLPQRIIILDDGSTDETQKILDRYRQNEIIKIIYQKENRGLHAAVNLLLNEVKTEFFAVVAADDMLTSDWCRTTSSLLERYTDAKMVISNSFILEDNRIFLTDSINTLNNKYEGVYTSDQYIRLLMKYGKFPPSNTILYRSDIIEELVRPVFMKTELCLLTDIMLILAIATKYPVAYSTKPTGIFIKSHEGYGSSFSEKYLENLIMNIKLFFLRDKFVKCNRLMEFTIRYIKYSLSKQIIINEMRTNKRDNSGLRYISNSLFCYFRLSNLFIIYKRFVFLNLRRLNANAYHYKLEELLDRSLLKRFDTAYTKNRPRPVN